MELSPIAGVHPAVTPLLAAALVLSLGSRAHTIDVVAAKSIMFDADNKPLDGTACAAGTEQQRIACMIDARYDVDKPAAKIARELHARTGSVSGLLPEQDFDGEYRGVLHLVPHLPVKEHRQHLEWLAKALGDIDDFFGKIGSDRAEPLPYRWRDLDLRFFRSVNRKTPSAIAHGWQVAYNVSGSLFTSAARVRETVFHEIFHLNDSAHGNSAGLAWAETELVDVYDRIVAKCGTRTACLTPYAPDGIIVRVPGGTYYAFMPDNGVREYAADLAKRYYVEQRQWMNKQKVAQPFKCKTAENADAWRRLVDEFFGGVDLIPACAPAASGAQRARGTQGAGAAHGASAPKRVND